MNQIFIHRFRILLNKILLVLKRLLRKRKLKIFTWKAIQARLVINSFDEQKYLTMYPDIGAAVKKGEIPSGYYHYINYGCFENREAPAHPGWREYCASIIVRLSSLYRILKNLMWQTIQEKQFERKFDEQKYLALYPEIAEAVQRGDMPSGYYHFINFGRSENRVAPKRPGGPEFFVPYLERLSSTYRVLKNLNWQFIQEKQFERKFDERKYLALYPEIAEAVQRGDMPSGYLHFIHFGRLENRIAPKRPGWSEFFAPILDWLSSIYRVLKNLNWQFIQEKQFERKFDEQKYLALYPEIAEAVQRGDMPSGCYHFIHFGYSEDRVAPKRPGWSEFFAPILEWLSSITRALKKINWHIIREKQFERKFDEQKYLAMYPEIAEAVQRGDMPSGCYHFINYGCFENRIAPKHPGLGEFFAPILDWLSSITRALKKINWHIIRENQFKRKFDEQKYLALYPEIAEAVQRGDIASGCYHFINYGCFENRVAPKHPGWLDFFSPIMEWASSTYGILKSLNWQTIQEKQFERKFDEQKYLTLYPEIAEAVQRGDIPSGCYHFINYGCFENRVAPERPGWREFFAPILDWLSAITRALKKINWHIIREKQFKRKFDEQKYLALYPEIARAVKRGKIPSGYYHFINYGCFENRVAPKHPGWLDFFTPIMEWLSSTYEILKSLNWQTIREKQFEKKFDEQKYLALYPEIEEAVQRGDIASGCFHFIHHGYLENREAPKRPGLLEKFRLQHLSRISQRQRKIKRQPSALNLAHQITFKNVDNPQVSIILIVQNQLNITLKCLASIMASANITSYEVVVIDNVSQDETLKILPAIPHLRIAWLLENKGFIYAANLGAQTARGKYVLFLNNATLVADGFLDYLLQTFSDFPDTGLVGAKIISKDGLIHEAGCMVTKDGVLLNCGRGQDPEAPEFNYVREVDYCSVACLMMPRHLFLQLDMFDDRYSPALYEDVDLAFKIRERGKKVYYQSVAVIYQSEYVDSETTIAGEKKRQHNKQKFMEKWNHVLRHDRDDGISVDLVQDHYPANRALIVDQQVPNIDRDAASLRIFNIMKILVESGFKVTFIPENLNKTNYTKHLQALGIEVWSQPYLTSLEEHLRENGTFYQCVIGCGLGIMQKNYYSFRQLCPKATIVFDTVELNHLCLLRQAEIEKNPDLLHRAEVLRANEIWFASLAELTLVGSVAGKESLEKDRLDLNVQVIPTIHEVHNLNTPFEIRKNFFFIGEFQLQSNIDAVMWFVSEIFPLVLEQIPEIQFYIIANHIPDEITTLQSKHIVVEELGQELEKYFRIYRLSIAPFRFCDGINSIMAQSLAYGLPCIATSIACASGCHEIFSDLLVADGEKNFAQAIIQVYQNKKQWEKLSQDGQKIINERFSYVNARQNLVEIFKDNFSAIQSSARDMRD
ncbi:glycosyltransferase [candidate division CSSED10-310 bacterium]|uniref:Glycosyltransferase n=1 Tax=candidate division CSSED10-310 bacterium TaxID=2855610 RepID=A0ABV6YSV0_UNCC1